MKAKLLFRRRALVRCLQFTNWLADGWYWLHLRKTCPFCQCRVWGNPLAKVELPLVCGPCLRQRGLEFDAKQFLPF